MRKRKEGRKFHREKDQRNALLKILSRSLILNGKIKTTQAKAKEVRFSVEKSITLAKKNNLAARRRLLETYSGQLTKKLIEEIGPKYKDRPGGYTRIIKTGLRKSDGAKMAIIQLL